MKAITKPIMFLLIAGMIWSCEEDESNPIPPTGNMVLNLENLEALPAGWTYEAWLAVGGELRSAGQFNSDPVSGGVENLTVPVMSEDLETADGFLVSIESTTDGDAGISATIVMAGDFTYYEAVLSYDDARAAGVDLAEPGSISGLYLIAAPTSASVEDDSSGIWFVDNSGIAPAAGLSLPGLNDGWIYEGWVVIAGVPVSTGRFSNPNGSDESCAYCGLLPAPPFPGEDLLANAPDGLTFPTNLAGRTAVISVEPEPDYSEGASEIKILAGDIPAASELQLYFPYSMEATGADVPSGSVLRFYGFDCTGEGCK